MKCPLYLWKFEVTDRAVNAVLLHFNESQATYMYVARMWFGVPLPT